MDLKLPECETVDVPEAHVLPVDVSEGEATEEWRDWMFPYLDRAYRPVKRPEFTLDRLKLVYTSFWIIDYGGERYAVSALTKQVELLEDIPPLETQYESLS